MVRVLRSLVAAALVTIAACSAAPTAKERAQTAELAQLTPLKAKFPGALTGFDIRDDRTLFAAVDVQAIIDTMEDPDIEAMKAAVIDTWRDAWRAQHPHQHAKLIVHFIDFRGKHVFEGAIDG